MHRYSTIWIRITNHEPDDPEQLLARSRSRNRSPHHTPNGGTRWYRLYYAIPRSLRLIVLTILVSWFLIGAFRRVRDNRDYAFNILATDFTGLIESRDLALWQPAHVSRIYNGTHIDDRYIFMRQLGSGMEGSTALYLDFASAGEMVVVKTYMGLLRNEIPAHLATGFAEFASKWPTEIEAGLLLGDTSDASAYVPVRDYFVLQTEPEEAKKKWHWAMVTPYIKSGTLLDLAAATKLYSLSTPQALDTLFRRTLHAVLSHLQPLHRSGYCHDDIKPDNVFVANASHWLLGDLGNVRHFGHPWHGTGRWKRENQWADCELNDVRRILKSYLAFLRGASGSRGEFDRAFYQEEEAWSQLYWQFMREPGGVDRVLELSAVLDRGSGESGKLSGTGVVGAESACLERKVDLELTCTSLHLRYSDRWPFKRC